MTVNISYFAGAGTQFFDNNGVPLAGGLLYTYASGTTTQVATYTSSSGSVANSNPIVLDSSGRIPYEIWLTAGTTVKFVLQTASATQIGSYDNIPAVNDATALNTYIALISGTTGSNNVGYNQGGTSAVTQTVQTKLQETLSVWDFMTATQIAGVLTSGGYDVTTAVQAAFNAANQTSYSQTVYFPAGTYIINTTINVNPNTQNGIVPQIRGDGADTTIIKAGSSLSTNPIFKHQGASPSPNSQWTGFSLQGTGSANGQWGIYHVNSCFINYDNINFNNLAEGVHFENSGAGFAEQNILTNCWATNCLYFITFTRASGSTQNSFRGTGFASECHMDLTTVTNSRLARIYYINSLSPNCYNMPIHGSVWTNATSAVIQNDGLIPFRALIDFRYEASASGWVMSTGNGSTTNFFTGTMVGLAYNPTFNNSYFTGFVNESIYIGNIAGSSGIFTPTIASGSGSPVVTYASNGQQGYYQVIGNVCQFSIFLNISSIGAGGSGNININGFPVTSSLNTGSIAIDRGIVSANNLTFTGQVTAEIQNNSNYAVLSTMTSGSNQAYLQWSALATTNCTLWISGQYFISVP